MQQRDLRASFPANFLWGAGTSAYQIEGAAREDGRGPSIWDQFAATPGKVYEGHTGAVATDHYHRMEADVDLMAELRLTAYRFSISWTRVQPDGMGAVNMPGLDFYDRLVDRLLARGIEPLVTLYHWDLPVPLHERGGWLNRDTAACFADYSVLVARRLGDRVRWWLTINEPWCAAYLGYGNGFHAPGMHDPQAAVVAGHHLLLAHGLTMPRLRALTLPDSQLGITLNLNPVYAFDDTPATAQAVAIAHRFNNAWFLDPVFRGHYPDQLFAEMGVAPPPIQAGDMDLIQAPLDYLGVNYYSRSLVPIHLGTSPVGSGQAIAEAAGYHGNYTDMGWEIYPEGLADLLKQLDHDYAPPKLIVTENGAAFDDIWNGNGEIPDPQRRDYLRDHIMALGEAIGQGVPVAGYFAWSLLDNFEWTEGYSKRFGLVYVDFTTQRRIIKTSGHWYADFIARQRAAHR